MAVKCQNCGKDNPEAEAFCKYCGREISQSGTRRCVSCGRSIGWDVLVCPYCGKDYRYTALAETAQGPQVGTGMKVLLYLVSFFIPIVGFIIGAIYYTKTEEDHKHVGKICIILGVVSIILSVGCSALMYVMVLGFGDGVRVPAMIVLRKSYIDDGVKIEFAAPSSEVAWSDVTFLLSDGAETVSWQTNTQDMTSAYPPASRSYGIRSGLSNMDVEMNATDLAGNGMMSNGDYITLTTSYGAFSTSTLYTLTLMYEPAGAMMLSYTFTG